MDGIEEFGGYRLGRRLGKGGMGEVFMVRTPWPSPKVAVLKRLHQKAFEIPTFPQRFEHEATLSVRFDHPNVVRTLEVGQDDGLRFVCSELVTGVEVSELAIHLANRGLGAPLSLVARIMLDVLSALAYVHNLAEGGQPFDIKHRDVSPRNVLIGVDGSVKLTDFGLAKSALTDVSPLTAPGQVLGTPSYIPPEVVLGGAAHAHGDVYGVGILAYEMLTGYPPYDGAVPDILDQIVHESPQPIRDFRQDLDGWFLDLLESMLERNPEDRPPALSARQTLLERLKAQGELLDPEILGQWIQKQMPDATEQRLTMRDEVAALPPAERKPKSSLATFDPSRTLRPKIDTTDLGDDFTSLHDEVTDRAEAPNGSSPEDTLRLEPSAALEPTQIRGRFPSSDGQARIPTNTDLRPPPAPAAATIETAPSGEQRAMWKGIGIGFVLGGLAMLMMWMLVSR